MPIPVHCGHCGRQLKARDEFAGTRAECPTCGKLVEIPAKQAVALGAAASTEDRSEPIEIVDFLDPPESKPVKKPAVDVPQISLGRKMLEAALDPKSIQWLLLFGGGLAVLGVIVWLVSLGLFKNKLMLAGCLGAGSLAVLGAGWYVSLKTKYHTAGQAVTFLGCVILPLNLWFWHAQGLVTLDNHLWIGGLICCALYAATIYVLKNPVFVYAMESGATLTVLLLLADYQVLTDTTWLAVALVSLGGISIYAGGTVNQLERTLPEGSTRKKYGLPTFWSGHVQLAAGALTLLGTQTWSWLSTTSWKLVSISWDGNVLSENSLLAGGLWLAATYLYVYSDLVVRRLGVYLPLGAFSLMMAEITLVGLRFDTEGLIAILSITAVVMNAILVRKTDDLGRLQRIADPLGLLLSVLPLFLGFGLHVRATSAVLGDLNWSYETGGGYVAAMLVAAVCTRISAWIVQEHRPNTAAAYFFLSGIAVVLATAGLLRVMGIEDWSRQAPILMVIPIGYMLASRFWRGRAPERPLGNLAHTVTAVILIHVAFSGIDTIKTFLVPLEQNVDNLYLGATFAMATLFYTIAAWCRRRSVNVYLAAAAACGAIWQFLGYVGVDATVYTLLYAGLGFGLLIVSRFLGVETVHVYNRFGEKESRVRGRGLAFFESGNGILCVAFLSGVLQGLAHVARQDNTWTGLLVLLGVMAVALLSAAIVPRGNWRRFHLTAAIALAGVAVLTLNALIDLSGWQKFEIFLATCGVLLTAASYVGLFREDEAEPEGGLSTGLWFGSLSACVPVLIAVLYHRFAGAGPHLPDELAIITLSIALVLTGIMWQVKSTTLVGSGSLMLYLMVLIGHLAYNPQVAVGVYLAIGGAIIFLIGVLLSVYREKLLALPEQIAKREGLFRIMNWR